MMSVAYYVFMGEENIWKIREIKCSRRNLYSIATYVVYVSVAALEM
jgi:hypothetical protein